MNFHLVFPKEMDVSMNENGVFVGRIEEDLIGVPKWQRSQPSRYTKGGRVTGTNNL